jgi:phosphoribosylformylglycinamidine (FGAM) synthase-like enzyme
VVRVEGTTPKALALSPSDVTPRYCEADPYEGGKQAVAEAWRNITAVWRPNRSRCTDNLNFGNPERPEIMGQLVGCREGHWRKPAARSTSRSCRATSALYNETNGRGILPTPTRLAASACSTISPRSARIGFARPPARSSCSVRRRPRLALGQSVYLRDVCGREEGAPPPVDLGHRKAQWRRGPRHDPGRHRDRGA